MSAKGEFIINDINPEIFDSGFNNGLLSWIANSTGGQFISHDNLNSLKLNSEKTDTIKQFYEFQLYKKISFVLLFILSVSLEYFLRKRWGLL